MIERLDGFPDNVVAVAAKGQVSKKDYEQVLVPEVERAFKKHRKVNFYYELGPQFTGLEPGAAWEDFKEGIRHFGGWDKMAMVTDVEWIKRLVTGFGSIMPGEARVFPNAEQTVARAWILVDAEKASSGR
ncbi:MAG: STAS/SEC14 domain-containing protein [Candidatus Acidiferrales bacterium]